MLVKRFHKAVGTETGSPLKPEQIEKSPHIVFDFARAYRLFSYVQWAFGEYASGSKCALLALKTIEPSISSSELHSVDVLRYHSEMREILSKYALCNHDGRSKEDWYELVHKSYIRAMVHEKKFQKQCELLGTTHYVRGSYLGRCYSDLFRAEFDWDRTSDAEIEKWSGLALQEYRRCIGPTSLPISQVLINNVAKYCRYCQRQNKRGIDNMFFYRLLDATLRIRLNHVSLFDSFSRSCMPSRTQIDRIYAGDDDSYRFFLDYRYYDVAKNERPGMSEIDYPTMRFINWLEDDAEHSWHGRHDYDNLPTFRGMMNVA